jgi:hypothetical protein
MGSYQVNRVFDHLPPLSDHGVQELVGCTEPRSGPGVGAFDVLRFVAKCTPSLPSEDTPGMKINRGPEGPKPQLKIVESIHCVARLENNAYEGGPSTSESNLELEDTWLVPGSPRPLHRTQLEPVPSRDQEIAALGVKAMVGYQLIEGFVMTAHIREHIMHHHSIGQAVFR